jgi:hypothetical protein
MSISSVKDAERMKSLKVIGVVFLPVGLICLVIAAFCSISTANLIRTGECTQGKVIGLNKTMSASADDGPDSFVYHCVVQFATKDNNQVTGQSKTGSYPANHQIGDSVRLYYEPSHPQDFKLDDYFEMWGIGTIFGGIGLIFAGLGGTFLCTSLAKERKISWLRANGKRLEARLNGVELKHNISINETNPFVVKCKYKDPINGVESEFVSDYVYSDPTPFLQSTVSILVDPNNIKRYHVDLSYLPPQCLNTPKLTYSNRQIPSC